jgi:Pyruvate/2-oxoacid:ferredoxin oxidoreductase gamma subunit
LTWPGLKKTQGFSSWETMPSRGAPWTPVSAWLSDTPARPLPRSSRTSPERPIRSIGVICGDQTYPEIEDIKSWVCELSQAAWFIDATDEAVQLGNPILGNIICVGALAATGVLPLKRDGFATVLASKMSQEKVALNLEAYDRGAAMIREKATEREFVSS